MIGIDPSARRKRCAPSSDGAGTRTKKPSGVGKTQKLDGSAFTLLIVDDESDLREAVAFDFKRRGFLVLEAESGTAAFELVQAHEIDFIISDMKMPHGDGMAFLEQLRREGFDIPLVFISGFNDYAEEECIAKGALKVLPKPFDRNALVSTVLECLTKR